jgi:ketosteroid isomerase-like protein
MTTFASDDVARAARDPVIAAVLAARARLDAAFAAQDVEAAAALMATDLIVNSPINHVAGLETVIASFKAGRMNYASFDVTIEALDGRGDHVVIMGEEVLTPKATAAHPGKTVRRRFTDVWRAEPDGQWRLTIRHATIISIE